MVGGRDGAMWATMCCEPTHGGQLSRIDSLGNQTFYTLGGYASGSLTPNPDRNIYVAEQLQDGYGIARVTPLGQVTDFALPGADSIQSMTTGSDNAIWMVRSDMVGNSVVARMDTSGNYTEYKNTVGSPLAAITRGSDKNLWCGGDVRVSVVDGTMTFFANNMDIVMTLGSDGLLWFVDTHAAFSVDAQGNAMTYPLKTGHRGSPQVSTSHLIWWLSGRQLGLHAFNTRTHRITMNIPFPIPGANGGPLAVGPDKQIWSAYISGPGTGTMYRIPTP